MAAPTILTGVRGPGALLGIDSWQVVWRPWEMFPFNNAAVHGATAVAADCGLDEIQKTSLATAVYDSTFVAEVGYFGLKLTTPLGISTVRLIKLAGASAPNFAMIATFKFNGYIPPNQNILFTRDEADENLNSIGWGTYSASNFICFYDIVGNPGSIGTYSLQLDTEYTLKVSTIGNTQQWALYDQFSVLLDSGSGSNVGRSTARWRESNFQYSPGNPAYCQVSRFGYSTAGPDVLTVPAALPNLTKDLTLVWDVLTSVQKDLILRWSVRTGITKDLILRWLTDGSIWTEATPVISTYTEVPRPPSIWAGDPQEN